MNIGERILNARKVKGLTQKEVGLEMHYPYRSADIRIAQYEKGLRVPTSETISMLAKAMGVSESALTGPLGYDPKDVMRALFELEDQGYTVDVRQVQNQIVVQIYSEKLEEPLAEWKKVKNRFKLEQLSEKEYLTWKLCWE